MIREVIATGRDVNTAIDNGCTELGIDRDNAQFEIISLPKKGFLGLKIYPAKVKVFEELPDLPRAPKPAPAQQARPAAAQQARPAAAQQTRPAPQQQQKPAAPRPAAAVQQPKPAAPHHPAAEKPRTAAPAAPRPHKDDDTREPRREFEEPLPQAEIVPTQELREKVEKAAVYLADIMRAMGFETIEVTPAYYSENVCLRLGGAQLGVVIGRRGETLDALQYLTSLVANRGEGEYIRVNIDSGNYREKREKTLTALARKLALQAVRTGKSTTLEPMNPYERRVIHGAVSQIRGAVSTSVGADPNRRVVISVADPAKRTGEATPERSRGGDRPGQGRGGRGGEHRDRDNREERSHALPAAPRTPLRPNTNTAASVAASKSFPIPTRRDEDEPLFTSSNDSIAHPETLGDPAPVVRRIDDDHDGATATFTATRPRPETPAPVPAPVPAPAPAKKRSDADLYGDIPLGVPIVSGDHPAAPKAAYVPAPKHEPKKIDGTLYGKVEIE